MKWGEAALILSGALVGWYATRRARIDMGTPKKGPSSDYLAGLNFLVNEQPDRAVEAFLRAVAVEPIGATFAKAQPAPDLVKLPDNSSGGDRAESSRPTPATAKSKSR